MTPNVKRTSGNMLVVIVVAAFVGACSTAFNLSSSAKPKSTTINPAAEITAARILIDSWSGQTDRLDRAQEMLARVLAANPRNYLALEQLARCQVKAGFINDDRLVRYRGRLQRIGRFVPGTLRTGEATIRKAIHINPQFGDGYVLLANIEFNENKIDQAAKDLARAEALGSKSPWLQLNWADIDEMRGEYAKAERRCRRILHWGHGHAHARHAAGGCLIAIYKHDGESSKVIATYQKMFRQSPHDAWLHGDFAGYLITLGRYNEAIRQAHAALRIMDYGVAHYTLAMALYLKWARIVERGESANAEKYFQEAYENYPYINVIMTRGALVRGGRNLIKALSEKKGVSINAVNAHGSTALLLATIWGRTKVVRFLLGLNANPNIGNHVGSTPLLAAAYNGNREIVDMLLAKGANIHATMQGYDAAAIAESRGYSSLAAMLRNDAANVH